MAKGGQGEAGARSERGQSTVEVAMVLPVLAVMLLAVVQIALVGRDYLLLWHSAREAARHAVVDPSPQTARDGAVRAAPGLVPSRLSVNLSGGASAGDLLTAKVSYRSPTEVPLVGAVIGDVDMAAEVTMRVE